MSSKAPVHKLRQWRRSKGRSQVSCAAEAGVTRQTWINWEAGLAVPNPRSMPSISAMTGGEVTANDFYPQKMEMPKKPGGSHGDRPVAVRA